MADLENSSDEATAEEIDRIARAMIEDRYPPGTVEDGCAAPAWDELVAPNAHPAEIEFLEAWRKKARQAVRWAVSGGFAARVRAEAVAEHRAEQRHWIEVGQQLEAEKRVTEAERDEYRRNWQEAEKRTARAVAEAVAGERQRIATAAVELATLTDQAVVRGGYREGGGERVETLWQQLGVVLPDGSVPVATPPSVEVASIPLDELSDWTELAEAAGATLQNHEIGCSGEYETVMHWSDGRRAGNRDRLAIISEDAEMEQFANAAVGPVAIRLQPGRVGFGTDAFEVGGSLPGEPVATPTEPEPLCEECCDGKHQRCPEQPGCCCARRLDAASLVPAGQPLVRFSANGADHALDGSGGRTRCGMDVVIQPTGVGRPDCEDCASAEQPEKRGVGGHAPGCEGWRPPTAIGHGKSVSHRCQPGCPRAEQPEER